MANEDLEKEIEKLKRAEENFAQREKLRQEYLRLKNREWEREHPRIVRLRRMLGMR